MLKNKNNLFKGVGCIKCNNSGYSGRTPVYEIMYIDEKQRRIIGSSGNVDEIRKYSFVNGMSSLRDECLQLLNNGITTFEEFMKLAFDY